MMRFAPLSRLSLQWKILLSTSVAITGLFAVNGWMVLGNAMHTTAESLRDEVQTSFQAYESLWRSRAGTLSSISLILSGMSDVRAAFSTGDEATIRDTAGELWSRISQEKTLFLVTDPRGTPIASLGGVPNVAPLQDAQTVRAAEKHFPRQSSGFMLGNGHLYHVAVTPVYVQSTDTPALLNVLVAGYEVDRPVAERLKNSTGGSEFLFLCNGAVIASTLDPPSAARVAGNLRRRRRIESVSDGSMEYAPLSTDLLDIDGRPVGQLWILRSFAGVRGRLAELRRHIFILWLFVIAAGLVVAYLLARKIVEPVKELDRAAVEVCRRNYQYHVKVDRDDELGRLARTFNDMCTSIQQARTELIQQERISTIGRLSSSIVHDLRNPLAAIYGGAEMLVDGGLSGPQVERLARNIYRASRRIQGLLQDLLHVCKGKTAAAELCNLRDLAAAACDALGETADAQGVSISLEIAEAIEVCLEQNRLERVFINLIGNALEVLPRGGSIQIRARLSGREVVTEVHDNGPGIAPEIRAHLFQLFVSNGKKNGLGLGLALSRQTILDHGGDMWVESEPGCGTSFYFRLPLQLPSGLTAVSAPPSGTAIGASS